MREVTPPVAHRTDVHPENCGDLLDLAPLQRQQNRPCPVRFTALLRFRQGAQCRLLRSISRQRRFSRHACLHSPHPRQTIHSIAHSQTVCLVLSSGDQVLSSGDQSLWFSCLNKGSYQQVVLCFQEWQLQTFTSPVYNRYSVEFSSVFQNDHYQSFVTG